MNEACARLRNLPNRLAREAELDTLSVTWANRADDPSGRAVGRDRMS
jgi:hypothetical protein